MNKHSMRQRYLYPEQRERAILEMKHAAVDKLLYETNDGETYSFRWKIKDYEDETGVIVGMDLWAGTVKTNVYVSLPPARIATFWERVKILFTGEIPYTLNPELRKK